MFRLPWCHGAGAATKNPGEASPLVSGQEDEGCPGALNPLGRVRTSRWEWLLDAALMVVVAIATSYAIYGFIRIVAYHDVAAWVMILFGTVGAVSGLGALRDSIPRLDAWLARWGTRVALLAAILGIAALVGTVSR